MVEGLVIVLFNFGRFLIPIALALALYWYLVRFRVDTRDRAALATAGIALPLTLAVQLLMDLLYVDNLALEISTLVRAHFAAVVAGGVTDVLPGFGSAATDSGRSRRER